MSSIPRINQLNSFKPSKSPFNSTSDHFDGIDLISESSKRIKSPGVISKNPGPYKGISFKGKGDEPIITAEEGSWWAPFSTKTIQKTRIRIPELHCHLPEPDDYENCKATLANLYPEFIGETTETKASEPRTIALCAYNDRTNFEEPTLLGPYSLDKCVTDGTNSSNVNAPVVLQGSAATGNAPGTTSGTQFPTLTFTGNNANIIAQLNATYGSNPNQIVRDIEATQPEFRNLLQQLIESIESQGLPLVLNETFRNQIRQNSLYNQGRQQRPDGTFEVVGSTVTNTLNSNHGKGTAADFRLDSNKEHPYWKNLNYIPKGPYDTSTTAMVVWQELGRLAVSVGLKWGGNWESFKDIPHVEMARYTR